MNRILNGNKRAGVHFCFALLLLGFFSSITLSHIEQNRLSCDAKTTLVLIDGSIYTELGSYEERSMQCSISTNGIVESLTKSEANKKEKIIITIASPPTLNIFVSCALIVFFTTTFYTNPLSKGDSIRFWYCACSNTTNNKMQFTKF